MQAGLPYQVTPLVDENYAQDRLVCQAWRNFDLQCFAHVSLSEALLSDLGMNNMAVT